jgi:hypothetical protein
MNFTIAFVAASVALAGSSLTVNGFMYTMRSVASIGIDTGRSSTFYQGSGRLMDSPLFLSPDDLTNYMAKAHEEKIRALKEIEDKKNAEIMVSCYSQRDQ